MDTIHNIHGDEDTNGYFLPEFECPDKIALAHAMSLKKNLNSEGRRQDGELRSDAGVLPSNSDDSGLSERLRSAVKSAGGNKLVSDRSGVPLATLNNYLAGRDPKFGAVAAIAEACGVSLDYLATGRPPIGHNQPPPEISGPRPQTKLFSLVDAGRLGHALRDAFAVMRERNLSPEWEDVARVAVILYDSGEITKSGGVP